MVRGRFLRTAGRHEVWFGGHLYDVAFEELRGDTLHLWGHRDRQEEEALSAPVQTFEGGQRGYGISSVLSLKNLHLLYLPLSTTALCSLFSGHVRYGLAGVRTAPSPFAEAPHPPPWA